MQNAHTEALVGYTLSHSIVKGKLCSVLLCLKVRIVDMRHSVQGFLSVSYTHLTLPTIYSV